MSTRYRPTAAAKALFGLAGRPTAATSALTGLASRLTERDFALIDTLARFGVMTTAQIAAVFFPSVNAAKLRLLTLANLGVLARTRRMNSGMLRHTLAWAGQLVYALRTDTRPPSRTEAELRIQRRFMSPKLAHDEGAVETVAAMHLACRQMGTARIAEWLSEAEATSEFVGLRPDAAFELETDDCRRLSAWYEHDTGTETIGRLVAKVESYFRRQSPLLPYKRSVLISVPSVARIRSLVDRVKETSDLRFAVGLHHSLPSSSMPLPDTTSVLSEPHWHLLNYPDESPKSLLELTSPLRPDL